MSGLLGKRGVTVAAGAFLGIFLAVATLMMWQSPLLFSFGLERAAFEEMRVLVVTTLVGSPLGAAVSWMPKPKPKTTLAAVVVAVFLFSVMWLVPLLLPMGSEPRLCWEEMRVVTVGLTLGCIAGYTFGWARNAGSNVSYATSQEAASKPA